MAASRFAERNQVIYWEMGGISDPIVERGFKYLFRITPMGRCTAARPSSSARRCWRPSSHRADKLKVSIVHEDALYGTTCGTGAEKRRRSSA